MTGRKRTEADTLTARQRRAVEVLLSGATATATAKAVGVRRQTISEWRKLPAFRAALDAGVAALVAEARTETAAMLTEARRVVREALAAGDVAVASRLLTAPHLAAFAGGADPGSTRIEHSGAVAVPPLTVRIVRTGSPEQPREAG